MPRTQQFIQAIHHRSLTITRKIARYCRVLVVTELVISGTQCIFIEGYRININMDVFRPPEDWEILW